MATSPLTIYKLIVLYMLSRAEGEVYKDRISDFLLANGYANFVSLLRTYAEIEENGLIKSQHKMERESLKITEEGRETLRLFSAQISADIKNQVDQYLKDNGIELRREQDVSADYFLTTSGLYEVYLKVKEKDTTVVSLTLTVPEKEMALSICKRWREKNEEIYASLIEILF